DGRAELRTFRAEAPEVGRGRFDPAHARDDTGLAFQAQPAADPTIRADGFAQESQQPAPRLGHAARGAHLRCWRPVPHAVGSGRAIRPAHWQTGCLLVAVAGEFVVTYECACASAFKFSTPADGL